MEWIVRLCIAMIRALRHGRNQDGVALPDSPMAAFIGSEDSRGLLRNDEI